MAGDLDIQRARDLFGTCDLDGSGYIDKQELAAVCDLDAEDLGEVFNQLDADRDGRISIEEFSENFMKFKNVVSGIKQKRLTRTATGDDLEDFRQRLGKSYELISGQEYVSELFHYMHNSNDSAQLLSLLESFLFSVVRDVKHYSSENAKLEEALKRACEKHAEHMEQLDDELDQQMSRLEMRIKKEEQSKFERSNLDMVWQLETKNKEIQALNAKVSKLENKIKKKEPEEQKLKEEIEEKVQELRYLRSQVTDAQTTVAVIRSELAQLKNDYEDQSSQLEAEKRNVMECVQEQESLTRQLQLLHEANKKLHDTNDDLRSALEMRRGSEGGKSPSPSKRNSISTLYSTVPRAHRRSKSHEPSSRRASNLTGEFSGDDRHPNSASASTPRSSVAAPPPEGSRRSSMLLPTQQSCEVDDPVNEDSLLSELMKVQRSHESPFDTQSTSSDAESVEHDYNHNAGILNAKETGRIHHLIPPARQSCEVESKGSPEDTIDPVVHRYEHAVHSGSHSSGSQSLPGDEVLDWDQVLKRVREIEEAGTCSLGGETDVSEESRVTVEEPALKRVKEAVESGDESIFEVDDDTNEETAQPAVSRPSERIEDDHFDKSGEYPNGEKQAKEPDVDRVPCIVLEEDSESDGGIDEVMSAKSSQRDEGIHPGSTEDQHVVSDSETVDDSNEFDIKSEEPYPANNLATSKETSFLNTTPEECIDKGKGSDEEARLEPVFSPRLNVGTGDSTPRVLLDPDIELFEKGEEPEYYTVFETEPVLERFERMKEIGLKRCPAFVRPGTRPLSERYRKTNFPDGTEEEDEAYSTMPSSERESLRQQLDLLQKTNNDLRTALEVVVGKTRSPSSKGKRRSERGEKCRRNASIKSTHSDYGSISSRSMSPSRSHGAKSGEDVADGAEELSGYDPESDCNNTSTITQSESLPDSDLSRADISELEAQFKSVIKEDEEDIDEDDVDDEELAQLVAMATGLTDSEEETETEDDDTTVGVREAAVGADSISEASTNTALNMSNVDERVPERMFKIVLAGDAAVGKSSFILRLCRNRFHSALNSTLGVDFQMKTLVVDGKTYALQLWDTAGQERFRSIAKSYFRKADGVLLLYDVTCETSFLDVRDWVEAIEESCSKPVPIMLCGNKIDIRHSAAAENKTVITAESGSRLAKEHGALFIETSSKENKNIAEACIELARMLRDVEDIEVKQNNGMKLTDNDIKKKKTNCCST